MNHNKHWLIDARRINFFNKLKIAIVPRNNVGPTLAQRNTWNRMIGIYRACLSALGQRFCQQNANFGPTNVWCLRYLYKWTCVLKKKRLSRFPRGDKNGRVKNFHFLSLDSLVCVKFVEFRPVNGWRKFNFVQIMILGFFKKSENKLITLKFSRITGPISTNTKKSTIFLS